MISMSAKAAQSHFGEMLSLTIREPVAINRYGKRAAVVISNEEYEKFQKLEDLYWTAKAEEAAQDGFLSSKESDDLLNSILTS
ncbi:MAG: type II toxin-antitoxin system prevent-host-death family antitoxin [Rickettsiales bacterium]|nr:MAG: type II toxin-antitoxin system prevent-host-death family antitoxin [Rickettsiales bacterium]